MTESTSVDNGTAPSARHYEKVTDITMIFQSRKWRITAVTAFVAMNASALIITLALSATVLSISDEFDLETLAGHTYSLKRLQYWILGVAGIAWIVDATAIAACMVKNRKFQIFVTTLLSSCVILTISVAIWGSVDDEGRKSFFRDIWKKLDLDTKYLLQNYFSCCGFDSIAEWQIGLLPIDESCFARLSTRLPNITWPNGCYDRVSSIYLNAVVIDDGTTVSTFGDTKVNRFYAAFAFCFAILTVIQLTVTVMFIVSIHFTSTPAECNDKELTIRNPCTISDEYSSQTNGRSSQQENRAATSTPNVIQEKTTQEHKSGNPKCWENVANSMADAYGTAFYWIGVRVAQHPKVTIVLCIITAVCLTLGIVQRHEIPSSAGYDFLSEDSQIVTETILRASIFYLNERNQYILVEGEPDAMSTSSFRAALDIDRSVKNLSTESGIRFSSICLRLGNYCKQRSLFELWSFNDTILDALTNIDILTTVNENVLVSPVFGSTYGIPQVLGGLKRDSSTGNITSARAHLLHYVTKSQNDEWEDGFINITQQKYDGNRVYAFASSSLRKEFRRSYTKDFPLFFIGFGLIFLYIMLMTGKFSLIKHRVYVALMGVAAAGLSMSAGIGVTSCFGLIWTNLHLIVPFLVLGIGVDDMFVILQAFDAVQDDAKNKHLTLQQKAGKALRSAGASITVTSVTDLVAFAVGATSDLAGFASFSVFVAVCIIFLFFLECSFFLACVVLDERRKENRYDACLVYCYQHDETYKPSKCGQREILRTVFEDGLGRIVTNIPFAVISICITLGVTGLMSWGFYKLEVRYDPNWYLRSTSYVVDYNTKYEEYFNVGADAAVYVLHADFFNEREKLSTLYESLRNNKNLNSDHVTSWFESYISWKAKVAPGFNVLGKSNSYKDAVEFYKDVAIFLRNTSGRKFLYDVAFRNGTIIGCKFDIRHRNTANQAENVDIISGIRRDCDAAGFSNGASVFPFGGLYYFYEITGIIRQEVYRNIGITMLCVFVMVMPMLASVQMGFWVALCVAITTVNVAGTMYFAGLSIETSTIISLLLSIGLAVDYAAHIGHKFLTIKGTRQMRTRVAVGQIGLAVFNGGFSTFLALVMLSISDTYAYKAFFTVFVGVVVFGLWTGLVFLPGILSIVGPAPYASADEASLFSKNRVMKRQINSREPISSPQTLPMTPRQ